MPRSSSTFDDVLRATLREEIATELAPLRATLDEFTRMAPQLAALARLAEQLSPLLGGGAKGALTNGFSRGFGSGVKLGPGRPRKALTAASAKRGGGKRGPKPVNTGACAIKGCGRPSRTKGYCAAHYQKLRNLAKTNRLPADWKDFPGPNSVNDVVLPRGRAASKALKARTKASEATVDAK